VRLLNRDEVHRLLRRKGFADVVGFADAGERFFVGPARWRGVGRGSGDGEDGGVGEVQGGIPEFGDEGTGGGGGEDALDDVLGFGGVQKVGQMGEVELHELGVDLNGGLVVEVGLGKDAGTVYYVGDVLECEVEGIVDEEVGDDGEDEVWEVLMDGRVGSDQLGFGFGADCRSNTVALLECFDQPSGSDEARCSCEQN
jgi:hypothetical protein